MRGRGRASFELDAASGGNVFAGGPDEIADRLADLHRHLGHSRHILQMDLGHITQVEWLEAIELLDTKVAPKYGQRRPCRRREPKRATRKCLIRRPLPFESIRSGTFRVAVTADARCPGAKAIPQPRRWHGSREGNDRPGWLDIPRQPVGAEANPSRPIPSECSGP